MSQNKNLLLAIATIHTCNESVAQLLKDMPNLSVQADSVLTRLTNSLSVAAGVGITPPASAEGDAQPLTHIFGKPIVPNKGMKKKETLPTDNTIEDIEYLAKQVIADIMGGSVPADVLEKHGELAIRAAAVMAGLDVTATSPRKLEVSIIADIYNAITDKADAVKAQDEADAAATLAANSRTPLQVAIEAYNAVKDAKQVLADAEQAKSNLPADANAQMKGQATKVINTAAKTVEEAEGLYVTAQEALSADEQLQLAQYTQMTETE
jgi:hypothetical protein